MITQETFWNVIKWCSYILLGFILNLAGIGLTNKYFWIILGLTLCIELASIWHLNSKLYRLLTDDDHSDQNKEQVSNT